MKNQFFTHQSDIEACLDAMSVSNYVLEKSDEKYGYIVNVIGSVNLAEKELSFIPLKFGHVEGDFVCSYNRLTSLQGAPHTVDGNFCCTKNRLKSLKGAPKKVGKNFFCGNNQLKNLIGSPAKINQLFYCAANHLTSLQGAPSWVGGDFDCSANLLTSLEFCPEHVGVAFICADNQISSLEFCPSEVHGSFYAACNPALGGLQHRTLFRDFFTVHEHYANIKKEKSMLANDLSISINTKSEVHKI